MKNYFTAYLFIILISYNLQAQTIIKGNITDSKGNPYPDICVILRVLPDSTIVSYDYSNTEGNYNLSYSGRNDKLNLSISGLQIVSQSKNIENINSIFNFTAQEQRRILKEVVVKSAKIWGAKDTVNYLVSSFSNKSDIVIGDVLKKMPGIRVSESGQISYQGEAINKFYIENLDLLGGRYGIATNNISAKDVSTVQILENHQPIRALTNVRQSNNAAINLKLKDGAKGTLTIMAQLGIGTSPLLWENVLSGMYFAKKRQNITTYKGNNTGANLFKELTSFTSTNSFDGSNNLLSVQMPSPPYISQNRYLFNNSNAATVNNLIKTGENSQVNFNVIYLNDHENRKSTSVSSYYILKDSTLVIDEDMKSSKNTNRLETELRYNQNDTNKYLNNYLNIQGLWTDNEGDVITDEQVHQQMKNPAFMLANTFNYIKKKGQDRGYEIRSSLGFKSSPQSLTIQPGLYPYIFNGGQEYSILKQNVRTNNFYFNNYLVLLSPFALGGVSIDPKFELGFENKNLRSDIYTAGNDENLLVLPADSLKNNLNWFKYYGSVGISLRYNYKNIKFNLFLPVSYHLLHINNRIAADTSTLQRVYFQPSLTVKYQITSRVELNGSYSFYNQMSDISTLYTGYVLQNYRSLNHYDNRLSELNANGGNVSLSYKDVIHMFFISGGIFYNNSKKNILFGQTLNGILNITSSIEQDNSSENISVKGQISKGIYLMGIVFSIDASYGKYSSEQLMQNQLVKYKNNVVNIAGSLSSKPASWLFLNYTGTWNKSWNKIGANESSSPIRTFVNNVSADLYLSKMLSLNANYEHYYNNAIPVHRYNSFTDLAIKYVWKDMHISLSWKNIFNTDNYASAYYNGINSYRHVYEIRGTNILLKIKFKLR
ncbi:MAG: hypothetical protein WCX48_09420 [Bacteroidales bacterium]